MKVEKIVIGLTNTPAELKQHPSEVNSFQFTVKRFKEMRKLKSFSINWKLDSRGVTRWFVNELHVQCQEKFVL